MTWLDSHAYKWRDESGRIHYSSADAVTGADQEVSKRRVDGLYWDELSQGKNPAVRQ